MKKGGTGIKTNIVQNKSDMEVDSSLAQGVEASKKPRPSSSKWKLASEQYTVQSVESKKGYTATNVPASSYGTNACCIELTQ